MFTRYKRLFIFLTIAVFSLAACVPLTTGVPTPTQPQMPTETPPNTTPPLPPQAALEAQRWLAEHLGIPVEEVKMGLIAPAEWTDSCLGLGGPDESCAQVITLGWLVELEVAGKKYEARTDESGSVVRIPSDDVASELVGTKWVLVSMGEPGAETAVVDQSEITLEFSGTSQAGGNAGCNSYGAMVMINGEQVSFSNIVRTLIACEDEDVMQQEDKFLQGLEGASEYTIMGNTLKIYFADGKGVLNLTKIQE